MYSKKLVTSNMLSMNLSRCRSGASTHSAGKPMSTALFCHGVQGDCSFTAHYSSGIEQGVDVYVQDALSRHTLCVCVQLLVYCVCVCVCAGGQKRGRRE